MKYLKKLIVLLMVICLFSAGGLAEKEDIKDLCGLTVANDLWPILSNSFSENIHNDTPLNEISFISNNRLHRFLTCDDMFMLHIAQTISDPSYVTSIKVMIRKDNSSSVFMLNAQEILEGAIKEVSKDGDRLFSRPFNTHNYWQYEYFFSTEYEITALQYVGEMPNGAIDDDYRWIETSMVYPSSEEMGKNFLTLSSFLATFFPDYTVEEFLEFRYINPYLSLSPDYVLEETGCQYETYIIPQDSQKIYVTLLRIIDEEDPYIFEIEIENSVHKEQEVLLSDYIHFITLLPGISENIRFPLRFLLGDEVTWTDIIYQLPYVKTEEWRIRFLDANSNGFPSINIQYIGLK